MIHSHEETTAVTTRVQSLCAALVNMLQAPSAPRRLPEIRKLCKMYHCSASTLDKALKVLHAQGMIQVVAGGGIFRNPPKGTPPSLPQPVFVSQPCNHRAYWTRARDALLKDINEGVFRPGERLPPAKLLERRYNVSYRTLRKALASCIESRRIHCCRGGYRVYLPTNSRNSSTVLLIGASDYMGGLCSMSPRAPAIWRSLEYQCRTRNLQSIVSSPEALSRIELESCPVLGSIIVAAGIADDRLLQTIQRLTTRNLTVAVINEQHRPGGVATSRGPHTVRWLQIGLTDISGRIMGEYLLNSGHRRVAFFHLHPDDHSELCRYEGLRRFYTEAGFPDGIQRFTPDIPSTTSDLHDAYYRDEITAKIGRNTEAIIDEVNRGSLDWPLVPLTQLHYEIAMSLFLKKYMVPLFDRAFNDPSISAWVGYNDSIGLHALDYLAEKGKTPPLIVASFDDTVQAISRGLTSYDFNIDSIVAAAMNHLFIRSLKVSGNQEELPGFVRIRSGVCPNSPVPARLSNRSSGLN